MSELDQRLDQEQRLSARLHESVNKQAEEAKAAANRSSEALRAAVSAMKQAQQEQAREAEEALASQAVLAREKAAAVSVGCVTGQVCDMISQYESAVRKCDVHVQA